jgi:hypothetical protein
MHAVHIPGIDDRVLQRTDNADREDHAALTSMLLNPTRRPPSALELVDLMFRFLLHEYIHVCQ